LTPGDESKFQAIAQMLEMSVEEDIGIQGSTGSASLGLHRLGTSSEHRLGSILRP